MNTLPKYCFSFIITIFIFSLNASLATAQLTSSAAYVRTQAVLAVDKAPPGSTIEAAVVADLETGWHINAHQPTLDYLIPTKLTLEPVPGLTFGEIQYPASIKLKFEFAEEALDVYEGRIVMRFPVTIAPDATPGETIIKGVLGFQACNNQMCLAPASVEISLPLHIASPNQASQSINTDIFGAGTSNAATAANAPRASAANNEIARLIEEKGLLLSLLSIFILGLALNLTPCVYPMIPITIGYFGHHGDGKTARTFTLALMYLLGIAVTYSALGVVAALTGQMFGALLQNSWVLLGIAAIMIALSLSMFGVYQLRPPSFLMQKASGFSSGAGLLGALSMGLVVGIVAAPCVGPVTIGLLTYVGATGNPWLGFWMFFVLSVGLGAPYVLLAMFSGAIKKLPRSGVWMIWVERLFGFMLIGMALYFIAPLLPDKLVPWAVFALTLIGGVYLGWIEKSQTTGKTFYWIKKGVSLAVLAIGIFAIMPKSTAAGIVWQKYDAAILAQAQSEGRPAILDFTADWCIPCRELDRFTFSHNDVIAATKPFVMVKVDMTQFQSPAAESLRQQFNVSGVPTIVFLTPQGQEVQEARVIGYLGPQDFLERLKLALPAAVGLLKE
ncbi:MAG: Thiol:disulfide interchange protein DsbD [bacterium]|nr:Thiol:disulfide interchange protein DsbD [bacterium]